MDDTTPAPGRPDLLASDQERDDVAAALGEAMAAGRLTSAEHAQRLDAAYAARTRGDLEPLTRDLPAGRGGSSLPAPAAIEQQTVTAAFSKVNRGGRWVAGRHTELRSVFGALIVDLSTAVLPGREIVLEANAFCGKLIVTLPRDARVIDEGGVLFGKRWVSGGHREDGPADGAPDGPVIRITGRVRFGKLIVSRPGDRGRWPWRDAG
jgi:Domain of unknown function (DUF1707)/Cell wall-active antibiotics response 4TMS YvqF